MAQVHSTWCPVSDRNPQKFVTTTTKPVDLTSFTQHSTSIARPPCDHISRFLRCPNHLGQSPC